ncbi:carbohydrate-binding protein [Chitinilyticum aquatile]|uniref:carbohydrate-binding protein n=1 Tax=Chitinilyticum aquatile TaxID=362520 RepID=UPI00138ADADD|nr:carbohydrate-binding protein [Chitinilyticum aquatile]
MNRTLTRMLLAAGLTISMQTACAASTDWEAGRVYNKNDTVTYQGRTWQAQWWNQGDAPGKAWGAWVETGNSAGDDWQGTRAYKAGEKAEYKGMRYQARWWTQGEAPGSASGVWLLLGPVEPPLSGMAAVHSGGRIQLDGDSARFSWPGVYFDARFSGSSIGLKFDDSVNHFDVLVDGKRVQEVAAPGKTTVWIRDLPAGEHSVRVAKRTESTQTSGAFLGFEAGAGGKLLAPPVAARRQIEFIGDSLTVGMGNTSGKRECTEAEITATTNANLSFGALTAAKYGADYQINGYSGLGMIRNYDGNLYPSNYRTYYDRALLNDAGSTWLNKGDWKPQVVVIGLGANDYNTPVKAGEAWTTVTRKAEYKKAYHDFLGKLRQQYGDETLLVLSATALWQADDFIPSVQEIVSERKAAGDQRVVYFGFGGLDFMGCQWHPSVQDHQSIAAQLQTVLDGSGLSW